MKKVACLLLVVALGYGIYRLGILPPGSAQPAAASPAATTNAVSPVAPAGPLMQSTAVEAHWLTDYAAAIAQSKQENKPLLINFTGSDWCTGCILLDQNVFNTPIFKRYADKNLVLLQVDFPVKKELPDALTEQNQALNEQYAVQGLPTVVVQNSAGVKLLQVLGAPADITAAAFVQRVQQAVALGAPGAVHPDAGAAD